MPFSQTGSHIAIVLSESGAFFLGFGHIHIVRVCVCVFVLLCVSIAAPVIVASPEDHYVEQGDHVVLNCTIVFSVPLTYQWQKYNDSSQTFSLLPEETDPILVFTSIEFEDVGTYRCIATNTDVMETVTPDSATITGKTVVAN